MALSPTWAVADFERAFRKALKFHFPSISLKGCFFHFKQAVCRWIFTNGYKVTFAINLAFKKWVRKLTSLAVVPVDLVLEAWESLKVESVTIDLQESNVWLSDSHILPALQMMQKKNSEHWRSC